jgi:hypothetical protein
MYSPGKLLVDLAEHIEGVLTDCGREIACVDLAYGSSVNPPQLSGDCRLKVDVGPAQNPFRSINVLDGLAMYDNRTKQTCSRGWRFNGLVRVTAPYPVDMGDCCHEHTPFTYEFTNTVGIVSEAVAVWLEDLADDTDAGAQGESTQSEYVTSYGGGAVSVGINFSLRVCMPSCDDLMSEEKILLGELNGLKEKGC